MRTIIFIDDDANVLDGLQRGLRRMRRQWNAHFFRSGAEALEFLETQTCDAVISDMRMPGMDGAALLTAIRDRFPATVRIVLSGYSEEASVLRTIGVAHRYLAKPADPQSIVDMVNRALGLRDVLGSARLRELLGDQRTLPTPPNLYFRLESYIGTAGASAGGVAKIIAEDLGMTAEVLRLANSGYFALASRVTSPLQAVRLLGFETLRALVLRIGIFRNFEGNALVARLMEALNRDSFLLARIARRIARFEGLEGDGVEEAGSAAMLSSLGLLFMLDRMPAGVDLLAMRLAEGEDLIEAEREIFGATHFQLAACLLALWGFRDSLVEAVAFAGQPGAVGLSRFSSASAVHVARVLAGPSPLHARAGDARAGCLALDPALADRLPLWRAEAAKA